MSGSFPETPVLPTAHARRSATVSDWIHLSTGVYASASQTASSHPLVDGGQQTIGTSASRRYGSTSSRLQPTSSSSSICLDSKPRGPLVTAVGFISISDLQNRFIRESGYLNILNNSIPVRPERCFYANRPWIVRRSVVGVLCVSFSGMDDVFSVLVAQWRSEVFAIYLYNTCT